MNALRWVTFEINLIEAAGLAGGHRGTSDERGSGATDLPALNSLQSRCKSLCAKAKTN
ncbi:MAG: hypothetical protein M0T78_01590 [Actinomycetota bacterium]|nr:hypothetical protein [Actinomycetota bacterium]